jgi:RNA-directed DNA polymerase
MGYLVGGSLDNLNHDHLMKTIGNFPARALIKKWLKAGVMVGLDLSPTPTGAPQGGIISPLLMNITLHGMEEAIGVKRIMKAGYPLTVSPVKVIRYADDLVRHEARYVHGARAPTANRRAVSLSP